MLDTGDGFLRHLEDAANVPLVELTASSMLTGLGAIGTDAVNVGRADLLLPPELLARTASGAGVPLVSANVVDAAGKPLFPGWVVKEIGGQRVGIFGVTGPAPPTLARRPGPAPTVQDPFAAARRAVAELRPTCRLVIALSQLGLEEDERLAREVPGIDVILGGHTRALTPVPRIQGSTLILHSGAKGMRLGRLEVEVAPGASGPWIERANAKGAATRVYAWELVQLDASIPDDPGLAALLERHREQLRARNLAEQAAAPPPAPLPAEPPYVGAPACGTCHPDQLREWSASGHARAMAALVRKKQDLNPECVRCHVTAFGEPGGYLPGRRGGVDLANVQCEACHGFGREHRGRGRIRAGVSEAICRRCHTSENSPTFAYEPYLKQLAPHAQRYFRRRAGAPPKPPVP
ncbi:MAG TPA: multiheme c-type cytochrome [bacterium]